ncbi:Glycogen synthase [uncultured Clostridium sp.]|nr:Glycogen synthase [uncultured Clostridium sp.]
MAREKILFVTSEAVPFIKTGGLADVAGTLPKYFDREKYDVRVILPKYASMKGEWKDKLQYRTHFEMQLAWRNMYVGVLETEIDGIPFYFIDNEYYFSGGWPYEDIRWDIEKFAFFSRAVLSALPSIDFRPDIIHCHDWQAALVPVYLNDAFQSNPFYQNIKTIMTIHNLRFQGIYDKNIIRDIIGISDSYFTPDKLEAYGDVNLLKGGIVYADRVTTVSETYAEEIKTEFYGEKLDKLLQARSNVLTGIVNGIDYNIFNPETDIHLPYKFNKETVTTEKVKNKVELQRQLGLREDPNVMMIGIVSRLTDQKGFDLIECVLDEICQDEVQIVALGTGEERYENMFRYYAWKYPGKVSANIYYSDELSHKIYGSCDAFLMPSLFEPCGLSQIMSLRYGTVPIVRETGGLKDTVIPFNEFENSGTGFSFRNYNAHEMMAMVRYAERIFYDQKDQWNDLVKRAMKVDFSWNASAEKYEILYDHMLGWYWPRGEEQVEATQPAEAAELTEVKAEEVKAAEVEATEVKEAAPAEKKAPARKTTAKKATATKTTTKKTATEKKTTTRRTTVAKKKAEELKKVEESAKVEEPEKAVETAATVEEKAPVKKRTTRKTATKKAEEPVKVEEPKKTEEPVKAEEPKKAAEPVKPEEPKKDAEPAKPEEPKKAAEPVKSEEPKKAAEPVKAEEANKVAEPEKVVEPVKAAPAKKTGRKSRRKNK